MPLTVVNSLPESLTFSAALGGSWLNRPLIWIVGFAPNVALAAILESSLFDQSLRTLLVSALLQFAVAACVLATTALWARRISAVVAMPMVFMLLGLTAIAQAFVGGLFAELVAGSTPAFGWRLAFWLAVQWLWSPLVINTLAQYEHRRYLFAERAIHIDAWNTAADHSLTALRSQHVALLAMIRSTVSPGIDDIRERLSAQLGGELSGQLSGQLSGELSPARVPSRQAEFLATADQLIVLSTSVQKILQTPHVTTSLVVGIPEHPKSFAPIAEAMNYEIRRPFVSAAVLAMLLLPVLAPGMYRLGGFPAIVELTIAVASSGFLFAIGLQLIKRFSIIGTRTATIRSGLVHLVAAIAAPLVVAAMSWEPLGERGWLLMLLLPPGFIFAAITISGAIGLSDANRLLVNELTNIRSRFARFRVFVGEEDARMNSELDALTHGPIRGRLSACIMALKFHAEELTIADSPRGETILRAVATHLDATARDLDRMNLPTPLRSRDHTAGEFHGEWDVPR